MFSNNTDIQKYEEVCRKANKVGKLLTGISLFIVILFSIIILISMEKSVTVGVIVLLFVVALVDAIYFYESGKNMVWTYYWLKEKSNNELRTIYIVLSFGTFIGALLRIKHHGIKNK